MDKAPKVKRKVGDLEAGDAFTLADWNERDGVNLGTIFIFMAKAQNAKTLCLQLDPDAEPKRLVVFSNITRIVGVRNFWEQPTPSTDLSGQTMLDEPVIPSEGLVAE